MMNFKKAVAVALLIASALLSCASDEEPLSPIGVEGLAAYDESIPQDPYHAIYEYEDSIEALTEIADLVFTGRVTGYEEAVLTIPFSPKSRYRYFRVFDGVVFTVEELLSGELPPESNQVTVRTLTMFIDEDKNPLMRISQSPRPFLREGIEQRNLPDSPLYLVYLRKITDPNHPNYSPTLFYFPADSGVVRIGDDGSFISGGLPIKEKSENGFTLEDARRIAQQVREDRNLEQETLDEVPLSPIGVEGLVAFDESIPQNSAHSDYIYEDSIESFTESVTLIFTGRVTGYEEAVLTVPFPLLSPFRYSDIYDSVVFTVEELLAGELPSGTNQATSRILTLMVDENKSPLSRYMTDPLPILREGIEHRNLEDGPLYLVYLKIKDPDNPYHRPGLHYFPADSGVFKINEDGSLSGRLSINNKPENGFTLETVRRVAQLVTEAQNSEQETLPEDLLTLENPRTELEADPGTRTTTTTTTTTQPPATTTTTTTTTVQLSEIPPITIVEPSPTTTTSTKIQSPPTTTTQVAVEN